jgi:predicted Zn finger-like uncharacterized protein
MITICPQCALPLSVTAADLRIAQGSVRCGRCAAVFNALASLQDESPTGEQRRLEASVEPAPAPRETIGFDPSSTSVNDIVLAPEELLDSANTGAFRRSELVAASSESPAAPFESDAARPQPASAPVEPADVLAEVADAPVEAAAEPDALESVEEPAARAPSSDDIEILESTPDAQVMAAGADEPPSEGGSGAESAEPEETPLAALPAGAANDPGIALPPVANEPAPFVRSEWRLALDEAAGADGAAGAAHDVVEFDEGEFERDRQRKRQQYVLAASLLGLALLAQVVHRHRLQLASTGALQGPVTSFYRAIGDPITPQWDIGRYEVRLQDIVADEAAGTLTLHASIRNSAERAQPAPMLRVALQDRFGHRIASRDLAPGEYLGAAANATASAADPRPAGAAPAVPAMIGPNRRIDAEVAFVDPGGGAVGCELDVCLTNGAGAPVCANK